MQPDIRIQSIATLAVDGSTHPIKTSTSQYECPDTNRGTVASVASHARLPEQQHRRTGNARLLRPPDAPDSRPELLHRQRSADESAEERQQIRIRVAEVLTVLVVVPPVVLESARLQILSDDPFGEKRSRRTQRVNDPSHVLRVSLSAVAVDDDEAVWTEQFVENGLELKASIGRVGVVDGVEEQNDVERVTLVAVLTNELVERHDAADEVPVVLDRVVICDSLQLCKAVRH